MKFTPALLVCLAVVGGCRAALPNDKLSNAIRERNVAEAKRITEEHPEFVRQTDTQGDSPLVMASSGGVLELVQLFVEKGAHVNYQNAAGYTSLMVAAYNGHHEVVSYLITKGAYLELANKQRERALSIGALRGKLDVVRVLLKAGAVVEYPDGGMPPIVAAVTGKNYDIVVAIAEAGADLKNAKPKMQGGNWPTPLAAARTLELSAIEAYLVSKGAVE